MSDSVTTHVHEEQARSRALDLIMKNKEVRGTDANAVLEFWRGVLKRSEDMEDDIALRDLVRQLKEDTDKLKDLKTSMKMHRDTPAVAEKEPAVSNLLRLLVLLLEELEKRYARLRDRHWAYISTLSTAFPKRHPQHEKDKKKDRRVAESERRKKSEEE